MIWWVPWLLIWLIRCWILLMMSLLSYVNLSNCGRRMRLCKLSWELRCKLSRCMGISIVMQLFMEWIINQVVLGPYYYRANRKSLLWMAIVSYNIVKAYVTANYFPNIRMTELRLMLLLQKNVCCVVYFWIVVHGVMTGDDEIIAGYLLISDFKESFRIANMFL